nr:unnamed protein product [Digitaria exilis]
MAWGQAHLIEVVRPVCPSLLVRLQTLSLSDRLLASPACASSIDAVLPLVYALVAWWATGLERRAAAARPGGAWTLAALVQCNTGLVHAADASAGQASRDDRTGPNKKRNFHIITTTPDHNMETQLYEAYLCIVGWEVTGGWGLRAISLLTLIDHLTGDARVSYGEGLYNTQRWIIDPASGKDTVLCARHSFLRRMSGGSFLRHTTCGAPQSPGTFLIHWAPTTIHQRTMPPWPPATSSLADAPPRQHTSASPATIHQHAMPSWPPPASRCATAAALAPRDKLRPPPTGRVDPRASAMSTPRQRLSGGVSGRAPPWWSPTAAPRSHSSCLLRKHGSGSTRSVHRIGALKLRARRARQDEARALFFRPGNIRVASAVRSPKAPTLLCVVSSARELSTVARTAGRRVVSTTVVGGLDSERSPVSPWPSHHSEWVCAFSPGPGRKHGHMRATRPVLDTQPAPGAQPGSVTTRSLSTSSPCSFWSFMSDRHTLPGIRGSDRIRPSVAINPSRACRIQARTTV